jgi:sugar lactone lactonase YvrE
VVTDSDAPRLLAYRVERDGSLSQGERWYGPLAMSPGASRPGSDGMTVDKDGRVYVATAAGLQVFDTQGRPSGVIGNPQTKKLSNVTFGGPKFDTLYVTCTDKVYRRQTKVQGAPYSLK